MLNCRSGSYCNNFVCTPVLPLESERLSDFQCASEFCEDGKCAASDDMSSDDLCIP